MSETWKIAYGDKSEQERSWTQLVPSDSLDIIDSLNLPKDSAIIDVGGGASYLVDNLVQRGFSDITLLDISPEALKESHGRNGELLTYIAIGITTWTPTRTFTLWHDRAVFHFLTQSDQQDKYISALAAATHSGSYAVIATFAPDGPEMCSGLPVQRWSSEDLAQRFESHFEFVRSERHEHTTPWGSNQPFTFVLLRRR
jgi:trans-aconitate methyltransferase